MHWSTSDLLVEGEEEAREFLHRDLCRAVKVSFSNKFGGCVKSVSFRTDRACEGNSGDVDEQ